MPDNVELDLGAGGEIIAADNIGGVQHQRVKPGFGVDGSFTDASEDNPFPVAPTAKVDSTNSHASTLLATVAFTGTSTDVSAYASVTVFVDTDVDGSLSMEFSTDGTNWDRKDIVEVDSTVSGGSVHTLIVVAQYFRVVYTNGAAGQGHFRLQTLLHSAKAGMPHASSNQQISKADEVLLVRIANDSTHDLGRGLFADKKAFHRFGHNEVIPNGSWADIWAYGPTDALYNWPTTDETFRVQAGGNVNDTSAGSGARTIQVQYLDANGDEQQDQLTLAGASASDVTSVTGRRFVRAWVDTVGTINSNNTGQIIIENSVTNEIVASITAGVGQTEMSMFTVPLGFTAYLARVDVSVSVGSNKDADVRMWQRLDAYTTSAPFGAKRLVRKWVAIQGSNNIIDYHSLPNFPALTDLWFEGKGRSAVTEIGIDADFILIKDDVVTVPQ